MAILSTEQHDLGVRLQAGALAGIAGGIMMAVFEMFYHAIITGMGVFTMPNMIATLIGFEMQQGFGAFTFIGLVMHLTFSAFLGIIWGYAFSKTPTIKTSLMLGLVYGYALYLIMFYLVTPLISPIFSEARGMSQIFAHLLFGASFSLYPLLVETFSHRAYR